VADGACFSVFDPNDSLQSAFATAAAEALFVIHAFDHKSTCHLSAPCSFRLSHLAFGMEVVSFVCPFVSSPDGKEF
jgi:hypothetical protein